MTGRLHRVTPPAAAARPFVAVPRVLRGLRDRFESLLREVGKFGVVGAFCYVLDVLIFNLVRAWTGQPILATTISTIIATTVAFVGNRFWTWRDRERSGLTREYTLYFGVNLVGLGIGVACLWISHNWLGSYWPMSPNRIGGQRFWQGNRGRTGIIVPLLGVSTVRLPC